MILERCPHCGTQHVQTKQRFVEGLVEGNLQIYWQVLRCQNPDCKRLVLVSQTNTGVTLAMYPSATFDLDAKAPISKEIRADFREAGLCLGAGCFKASLTMSRRVLQRILMEQGCTQNKLVDAINHALSTGLLRKSFHPLAEEIRQYGNLGAHPDDDQLASATKDSAQQVLDFARLLVHEFYEVPATAAALKTARQKPSPP